MGMVLSTMIDNMCDTCDGLGKYPIYRTCYNCHGTGYYYSVQGTFIDVYEKMKNVSFSGKFDNRRVQRTITE